MDNKQFTVEEVREKIEKVHGEAKTGFISPRTKYKIQDNGDVHFNNAHGSSIDGVLYFGNSGCSIVVDIFEQEKLKKCLVTANDIRAFMGLPTYTFFNPDEKVVEVKEDHRVWIDEKEVLKKNSQSEYYRGKAETLDQLLSRRSVHFEQ